MTHRVLPFVLAAAIAGPPTIAHAQAPPLAVGVEEGVPRLAVGEVLAESALEDALRSGLPLRLQFRLELWRDRLFDELVDHAEWTLILVFEPLDDRFLVGRTGTDGVTAYGSLAEARAAVETTYTPALRPRRSGRYYYLAALEIESLSLSDLEELGHWLRGELGPAVGGRGSVAGALGTGVRRLIIRVLDLPARQYQARSGRFAFP